MLQGWTLGQNRSVIQYTLNTMGDLHGAIAKCWPEVAGTLGSGRQTSELCLSCRTSLAQFPAFSSGLFVAGPVGPRETGRIIVQWPSVTERSFNWSVSVGSLQVVCSRARMKQLEICRQL